MARPKKLTKKQQAIWEQFLAEYKAKQRAEDQQKIEQINRQDAESRARKKAEYEAAYPPGFLYTRDVMGVEIVPGTTNIWRRIRPKGIRGPLKGSGFVNETNKREAIEFLISTGREVAKHERPTKDNVGLQFQGKYGITGRSTREAREKAIDRLIQTYNPAWTWKKNILPRILQK